MVMSPAWKIVVREYGVALLDIVCVCVCVFCMLSATVVTVGSDYLLMTAIRWAVRQSSSARGDGNLQNPINISLRMEFVRILTRFLIPMVLGSIEVCDWALLLLDCFWALRHIDAAPCYLPSVYHAILCIIMISIINSGDLA